MPVPVVLDSILFEDLALNDTLLKVQILLSNTPSIRMIVYNLL